MSTDVHEELVAGGPAAARSDEATAARSPRLMLIVALSAAAGVIHARAMFDHASHYWLFGVFFGALTYGQILWAVRVYRKPEERWLFKEVAIASLGVIAIWLVSRTVGLPFGPWKGETERIGVADVSAGLDELLLAGLIFATLRPDRRIAARLAWLTDNNCVRVGMMLCALSLLAAVLGNHTHPATVR
jgi:hypothetical protein